MTKQAPHGGWNCQMGGQPHAGTCDEPTPISAPTPTACPFCEIVAGRAPATILEDWLDAMAIKPLNPVTPGHVLIIPKRHVTDLTTDPGLTGTVTAYAARFAAEWGVGDCNVITSRGATATQTVHHLHLHVVPRVEGDGLHLPWTGQRTAITTTKDGS